MKTYKNLNDSFLGDVFKESTLIRPSNNFTKVLMVRIEKEAIKQERRKTGISFFLIAVGIIGMLALPLMVFYLFSFSFPEFDFVISIAKINVDPMMIMAGCSVLLLLVADTLLRKYFGKKM